MELTRLATAAVMREGLDQEGGDSHQTELWVEKFKPKSYTELLSDNGTNRTLLMWLKLWDKLVFGKERKVKKPLTEQEQEKTKFKTGPQLAEVIVHPPDKSIIFNHRWSRSGMLKVVLNNE